LLLLGSRLELDFPADFLSHTILIGFLTGVGIQISISELSEVLRLPCGSYGTLMQMQTLINKQVVKAPGANKDGDDFANCGYNYTRKQK
jgi:MFS superfamily sulfate permease-like transporter